MQARVRVASAGTCMGALSLLASGREPRLQPWSRGHRPHRSWQPLTRRMVRVLGPRDGGTSVLKASSAAAGKLGQMTGLPEFCLHVSKTQRQKAQGPGSGVKLASAHSCQ